MQTKYVIETIDELIRIFEQVREMGDKFPTTNGKLIYMPMSRMFTLSGDDRFELGESLQGEQGAKFIIQHLCKQSGVPIEWAG